MPDDKLRSRALLDLANGAPCANCNAQDGTIVAAHSNLSWHGKGAHTKAHDIFHAHLCHRCHGWLDQGGVGTDPTGRYQPTREDKREMFIRAMHQTWLWLWKNERIGVTG